MEKMDTHILNTHHEAEHERVVRSDFLMHFIPSSDTSMDSSKKAHSLSIEITNQEKEKYFLYNQIKSIESFINMLTSIELCFAPNNNKLLMLLIKITFGYLHAIVCTIILNAGSVIHTRCQKKMLLAFQQLKVHSCVC